MGKGGGPSRSLLYHHPRAAPPPSVRLSSHLCEPALRAVSRARCHAGFGREERRQGGGCIAVQHASGVARRGERRGGRGGREEGGDELPPALARSEGRLALAGGADDACDRDEAGVAVASVAARREHKKATLCRGETRHKRERETHRLGWSRTKYIFALRAAGRGALRRGPSLPSFATTAGPLVSARATTRMSRMRGDKTLNDCSTPVRPTRLRRRIDVSRPWWRRRRAMRTPEKTVVGGEGLEADGAEAYEVTVRTEPGRRRRLSRRLKSCE